MPELIKPQCPICGSKNMVIGKEIFLLKAFEQTEGKTDQGIETGMGMKVKTFVCLDCKFVGMLSVGKIKF